MVFVILTTLSMPYVMSLQSIGLVRNRFLFARLAAAWPAGSARSNMHWATWCLRAHL